MALIAAGTRPRHPGSIRQCGTDSLPTRRTARSSPWIRPADGDRHRARSGHGVLPGRDRDRRSSRRRARSVPGICTWRRPTAARARLTQTPIESINDYVFSPDGRSDSAAILVGTAKRRPAPRRNRHDSACTTTAPDGIVFVVVRRLRPPMRIRSSRPDPTEPDSARSSADDVRDREIPAGLRRATVSLTPPWRSTTPRRRVHISSMRMAPMIESSGHSPRMKPADYPTFGRTTVLVCSSAVVTDHRWTTLAATCGIRSFCRWAGSRADDRGRHPRLRGLVASVGARRLLHRRVDEPGRANGDAALGHVERDDTSRHVGRWRAHPRCRRPIRTAAASRRFDRRLPTDGSPVPGSAVRRDRRLPTGPDRDGGLRMSAAEAEPATRPREAPDGVRRRERKNPGWSGPGFTV